MGNLESRPSSESGGPPLGSPPPQERQEEGIVENQREQFLDALADERRGRLKEEDYKLCLPLIRQEAADVLQTGDGRKIEALRDRILAALNPVYQKNRVEENGQTVWKVDGSKSIPLWGDDRYPALEAAFGERLEAYQEVPAGEDVVPVAKARLLLSIVRAREGLLETPRGLLMELYAKLDREVGK